MPPSSACSHTTVLVRVAIGSPSLVAQRVGGRWRFSPRELVTSAIRLPGKRAQEAAETTGAGDGRDGPPLSETAVGGEDVGEQLAHAGPTAKTVVRTLRSPSTLATASAWSRVSAPAASPSTTSGSAARIVSGR